MKTLQRHNPATDQLIVAARNALDKLEIIANKFGRITQGSDADTLHARRLLEIALKAIEED